MGCVIGRDESKVSRGVDGEKKKHRENREFFFSLSIRRFGRRHTHTLTHTWHWVSVQPIGAFLRIGWMDGWMDGWGLGSLSGAGLLVGQSLCDQGKHSLFLFFGLYGKESFFVLSHSKNKYINYLLLPSFEFLLFVFCLGVMVVLMVLPLDCGLR
ncbi:hypothetical protein B0T19DRAFT_141168 [Cercophora scortea]|uniref:Uncharacterized protein n=1 Tax=Cercophora scortea TaxID=314031 RepID=A0AAE0IZ82_9PEZI|nr:hypothetical protein B0T19DRAFT_141168 [Cercophora scortea]